MTYYLLNMGVSLNGQYANNGYFQPAPSGGSTPALQQSCTWLKYVGSGFTPSGDCTQYNQALVSSDWQVVSDDSNPFNMNPGDYLLVRVFPADATVPSGSLIRMLLVLGRGTQTPSSDLVTMQTPLRNGSAPRPLVDTDNATSSSWQGQQGGAWTYCIGQIYAVSNPPAAGSYYGLSVGVSLETPGGTLGSYGHDPTLHVVGG
jgi:hypothetical protein